MVSRFAPLPHEYMLIGIIGFFISVFGIYKSSITWGFALSLFFLLMVIASLVSMTDMDFDESTLDLVGGKSYVARKRPTLKKKHL